MQMSYGLYWRFLEDLAYLKEPVEHAFLVVSSTQKKTSFSTKRKVVKDN